MNTSVNAFKSKYNCLPGDCSNQSEFFSGVANGNGDGQINEFSTLGAFAPGTRVRGVTHETTPAFQVLGLSGLLEGAYIPASDVPGIGYPLSKFGATNGIIVVSDGGFNYWRAGITTSNSSSGVAVWESDVMGFTPSEAANVSSKIGDGTPMGQTVRAVGVSYFILDTFFSNGGQMYGPLGQPYWCYDNTVNQWNLKATDKLCNLIVRAQF